MIILSHISAFQYWRSELSATTPSCASKENDSLNEDKAHSFALLHQGRFLEEATKCISESALSTLDILQPPYHILRGEKQRGNTAPMIRLHRCGFVSIPADIQFASKGLLVVSPEACFLQLAGILDLPNLIMAGCELCAAYRFPIDTTEELPHYEPATTLTRLEKYLSAHPGAYGISQARRSLRYIHENTASPAEAVLAQLLHNPYSLGGYGFKKPEANRVIQVTGAARKATDHEFFVADLYWHKERLDVEYNGSAYHSSHKERSNDAERRSALELMGIKVEFVTRDQLFSRRRMNGVAISVAHRLGKQLRPGKDFQIQQIMLRTKLLHYLRTNRFDQPGLYQ